MGRLVNAALAPHKAELLAVKRELKATRAELDLVRGGGGGVRRARRRIRRPASAPASWRSCTGSRGRRSDRSAEAAAADAPAVVVEGEAEAVEPISYEEAFAAIGGAAEPGGTRRSRAARGGGRRPGARRGAAEAPAARLREAEGILDAARQPALRREPRGSTGGRTSSTRSSTTSFGRWRPRRAAGPSCRP